MSLRLIATVPNCFEYVEMGRDCYPETPPLWGPDGLIYNGYLVTCPRHYVQTLTTMTNFIYDPALDKLLFYAVIYQTAWPSWGVLRYEFDAGTGEWLNRDEILNNEIFIGIWGMAYTSGLTVGSYNKVYGMRVDGAIAEVDKDYIIPVEGGWSINPFYGWDVDLRQLFNFALVNRVDNYLVGSASWNLIVYRDFENTTTPTVLGTMRLTDILSSLCFENDRYCWLLTTNGTILKFDYTKLRYEMISSLINPEPSSQRYHLTYDTKRKRVAIMRIMPDAADGACQCQLEFYRPLVDPYILTDPVPVTSLRGGGNQVFVANLVGSAGEGITPCTVHATKGAGVNGQVVSPFSNTSGNGSVSFVYKSDPLGYEDSLSLEATVDIGE